MIMGISKKYSKETSREFYQQQNSQDYYQQLYKHVQEQSIKYANKSGELQAEVNILKKDLQRYQKLNNLLLTNFKDRNYFLEENDQGFTLCYTYQGQYQTKILRSYYCSFRKNASICFNKHNLKESFADLESQKAFEFELNRNSLETNICPTCNQGIPILKVGEIKPL